MVRHSAKSRAAPARARTQLAKTAVSREEAISENPAPEATDDRQFSDLTASVYEQLRSDVLRGRLRPGEKLRAEALRLRFNIGSSPTREALNRLLAEGLVGLEARKGFHVAPVSQDELKELVTARCWIDGAAVAEGIRRADLAWEEQLIVALHRLTRAARGRSSETEENADWEEKHHAFHSTLVGGCGTRWIIRISDQLFDAAERYRLLAADYVPERNELSEHKAIVEACLERDSARAVELLTQHYGQTYQVIIASALGDG